MRPELEPVRVRALISAAIQLLAVFGISVSADLGAAITTLLVALIPLLTWLQAEWARRQVSPVERD